MAVEVVEVKRAMKKDCLGSSRTATISLGTNGWVGVNGVKIGCGFGDLCSAR
jgi:hypothetical protein